MKKLLHSKHLCILLIFILLISLCGCAPKEDQTIAATTTYFFGLYPEDSRGIIKLNSWSDEMQFKLESSGINRQYVVMLFLDYEQIPFYVDNQKYEQYYIDVKENDYSRTFSFHLAQEPSEGQIHKLTGIVAAYSDIHLAEQDSLDYLDDYSIIPCYNLIIGNAQIYQPVFPSSEDPDCLFDSYSSSIVVNSRTDKLGSYIPEKEIHVKKGESLTLQYDAGGYSENNNFLLFATAGFQQMDLNGQKYIYFSNLPNKKMAAGFLQMQTPDESGSYEVIVYMIPEPFLNDGIPDKLADGSYRFTLVVED